MSVYKIFHGSWNVRKLFQNYTNFEFPSQQSVIFFLEVVSSIFNLREVVKVENSTLFFDDFPKSIGNEKDLLILFSDEN